MSRQPLRVVRDTDAAVAAYKGPAGEPVMNQDTGRLHIQDGQTPGGVALAKLVETQDAATRALLARVTDGVNSLQRNDGWNWATLRRGASRLLLTDGRPYDPSAIFPGGDLYGAPSSITGVMSIPVDANGNTDGSNSLLIVCSGVAGLVTTKSNQAAAVGVFGMARAGAEQARIWGANFVAANWLNAGAMSGDAYNVQIDGIEIDVSWRTPKAGISGSNLDCLWIPFELYGSRPDGACNGVHIGIYGDTKGKNAFQIDHGAADYAMQVGKSNKTGASGSQPFFHIIQDAAGNDRFLLTSVTPTYFYQFRPLGVSSTGPGGVSIADAGGTDRITLGADGSAAFKTAAGGGVVTIGSSDGGARNETLRFQTAFPGTANDKILGEIIGAPDGGSGGRMSITTMSTDGSRRSAIYSDASQRTTIGSNSTPGTERLNVDGNVAPVTANTGTIGVSGKPWNGAYFQTQPAVGSDLRFKRLRGAGDLDAWDDEAVRYGTFTDAELDAWGEVSWRVFQMRDAIALKGADAARDHYGLIAQEVEAAFRRHGVEPARLALWLVTPVYETLTRKETVSRPTGRTITRKALGEDGAPQRQLVPTGEDARAEQHAVKLRERDLFAQASAEVGERANEDAARAAVLARLDALKASDAELSRLTQALEYRLAEIEPYREIDIEVSEPEFEDVEVEVEEQVETGATRLAVRYESAFAIEAAYQRRASARLNDRVAALEAANGSHRS